MKLIKIYLLFTLLNIAVSSIAMEEGIHQAKKMKPQENPSLLVTHAMGKNGTRIELHPDVMLNSFDIERMKKIVFSDNNAKAQFVENTQSEILENMLRDNYRFSKWNNEYPMPFSECLSLSSDKSCLLKRSYSDIKQETEQEVSKHSKKYFNNKDIIYLGFASGKLFPDICNIIHMKENNIGLKKLIIIDPQYESLMPDNEHGIVKFEEELSEKELNDINKQLNFLKKIRKELSSKDLVKARKLVGSFDTFRIYTLLILLKSLYQNDVPLYVFSDVNDYQKACKKNDDLVYDIAFSCDTEGNIEKITKLFHKSKKGSLSISLENYLTEPDILPQVYGTILYRKEKHPQDTKQGVLSRIKPIQWNRSKGWETLWDRVVFAKDITKDA